MCMAHEVWVLPEQVAHHRCRDEHSILQIHREANVSLHPGAGLMMLSLDQDLIKRQLCCYQKKPELAESE